MCLLPSFANFGVTTKSAIEYIKGSGVLERAVQLKIIDAIEHLALNLNLTDEQKEVYWREVNIELAILKADPENEMTFTAFDYCRFGRNRKELIINPKDHQSEWIQ